MSNPRDPETRDHHAALLEEAEKLEGRYGIVGGNYIFDRLVAALRASLDREQEMREKLDTRDRQVSESMVMALLEADRLILRKRAEAAERDAAALREGRAASQCEAFEAGASLQRVLLPTDGASVWRYLQDGELCDSVAAAYAAWLARQSSAPW